MQRRLLQMVLTMMTTRMTKTKESAQRAPIQAATRGLGFGLSTPAGANGLAAPPPLDPSSPARRSRPLISQRQPVRPRWLADMDDAALRQLEYKEDETKSCSPTTTLRWRSSPCRSYPCVTPRSTGSPGYPHFLRYVTTPFEPDSWTRSKRRHAARRGLQLGLCARRGATICCAPPTPSDGGTPTSSTKTARACPSPTHASSAGATAPCRSGRQRAVRHYAADRKGSRLGGQHGCQHAAAGRQLAVCRSVVVAALLSQATQSVPMGSSGSTNRPRRVCRTSWYPTRPSSHGGTGPSRARLPSHRQTRSPRRTVGSPRRCDSRRLHVWWPPPRRRALDPEIEKARIEKSSKMPRRSACASARRLTARAQIRRRHV